MVNYITAKEIEEIKTEVRKVYADLAKLCKMFGLEVPDFTEDENRMAEEKLKIFRLLKQHPSYGCGSTPWRIGYNY